MANLNSPITNLFGEENWNAPSALSYWYYGESGMITLESMFSSALQECECL